MIRTKHHSFENIFAVAIVLLPVLSVYSIAGGLVDLDVVFMVGIFIYGLFNFKNYFSQCRADIILLILYIILVTIINLSIGTLYSDSISIIMRCGRYCLYLFIVFTIGKKTFNYETVMRVYRVVAYLAFIYISIQAVSFYAFGITLPYKIGGVSEITYAGQQIGRLRAFYSEPAALCYSLLPFVVCCLFGENYKKKDTRIMDALFTSACIVISTSSQGVLTLIVLWTCWLIIGIKEGVLHTRQLVYFILVLFVAVILYNTGIVTYAINRVSGGIGKDDGAVAARASGYVCLQLLNTKQLLFGTGYGNYVVSNIYGLNVPYQNVNYSSIAEHIFTTGIVGAGILLTIFLKQFFQGSRLTRMLLLTLLILSLMGCPLSGKFFPIYFCLYFFAKSNNSFDLSCEKGGNN